MGGKDPLQSIRENCVALARAETYTGVFEWFDCPLIELNEWVAAIEKVAKAADANAKGGRRGR